MTPENDSFELTYATMFDPPEALHNSYDNALEKVKSSLGQSHAMLIDGHDITKKTTFKDTSPINTEMLLGTFPKGDAEDARRAISAARSAFPTWSRLPWQKRVTLLRRAADEIDHRIYDIAAVISLEVGKNRLEALGDIAEAAALIRYACSQMEARDGFRVAMGRDPLIGYEASNTSTLQPYGVWVVISPFNFPAALTVGPVGAALVAGNTVVMKPASDTPWTSRLLAEAFQAAGLPDGVVNYVTGPGSTVGQELISSREVDGITFTGSYDVGMNIYRTFAAGRYPRPLILEMGGKNASIVSERADLERAAIGIVRSSFGLQGQKCSANSRVYVAESRYDDLLQRVVALTEKITIGDPTRRSVFLGPVINRSAYDDYQRFTAELSAAGTILAGGRTLKAGALKKGYFCAPTFAIDVPHDHRLWKQEMFLPITLIKSVASLDEAMQHANDSEYGLTAGFYGSEEEAAWFFDNIQAGVTYANRPQGSTTGAWPGYQPFGGWKGSGSSGKNAGGHYYLQLYMREQIHTLIR